MSIKKHKGAEKLIMSFSAPLKPLPLAGEEDKIIVYSTGYPADSLIIFALCASRIFSVGNKSVVFPSLPQ